MTKSFSPSAYANTRSSPLISIPCGAGRRACDPFLRLWRCSQEPRSPATAHHLCPDRKHPTCRRNRVRTTVATRQTVAEIEAAIAKLPESQQWEIAKWLEQSLHNEETPAMLTTLGEGMRSLETGQTVPREEGR